MRAFFKRRWILLSCIATLLACSFFSGVFVRKSRYSIFAFGLAAGNFHSACYFFNPRSIPPQAPDAEWRLVENKVHAPRFGTVPRFWSPSMWVAEVPLWLLLAIAISWLAGLEWLRREILVREAEEEEG
jgi:hypothetical protein